MLRVPVEGESVPLRIKITSIEGVKLFVGSRDRSACSNTSSRTGVSRITVLGTGRLDLKRSFARNGLAYVENGTVPYLGLLASLGGCLQRLMILADEALSTVVEVARV